ncbi:MAG: SCP2 sterol-binding domain-containing protein [Candidatus Helarchaeota archaeon]
MVKEDDELIEMRLAGLVGIIKQAIEGKLKYDPNAEKYREWIKDWNFYIEIRLKEEKRSIYVGFKNGQAEVSTEKFEGKPRIILKGKHDDILDYCNGELDRLIDVILLRKIQIIKGIRLSPLDILTWRTVDDLILLDRLDKLIVNK